MSNTSLFIYNNIFSSYFMTKVSQSLIAMDFTIYLGDLPYLWLIRVRLHQTVETTMEDDHPWSDHNLTLLPDTHFSTGGTYPSIRWSGLQPTFRSSGQLKFLLSQTPKNCPLTTNHQIVCFCLIRGNKYVAYKPSTCLIRTCLFCLEL